MYCRNCANELSEHAIACPKCGVPPKKGKNFCYQCANPTVPEAIICVSCGVSLANTPLSSINKREYLTLWGKYSYSTYVFILLLSLLPFVDLSCNEKKVYTINGYELTVGKERTYTKNYNLGMYGSYDKEKTEVISNLYIQIFYAVIIAIIVILLLRKRRRFEYAQWGSVLGFALLIIFVVTVNSRVDKEKTGMVELSYGYGYWLTLLTLIVTFGIIFLYRKEFNNDEEPTAILEPIPPVQQSSPPVIEQPIVDEATLPVIFPISNVETLQTLDSNVEAYPDYPFDETKSNIRKYIIIGLIAAALIAIIYFVATREKPVSSSAEIISEMPKQSDIHDQSLNVVPTPLPAENHSNIKQLSSKEIEAFADANRSDIWKIFNHKYGFKIELPSYFKEGSLTASGIQYYINDLNDNIMITVETNGIGSNSSLATDYQTTINSSSGIKYKTLRDNWFVISGQDNEGIYYLKSLVKNGQTHFLGVRYPSSQKDIFDSILPRISKSFK